MMLRTNFKEIVRYVHSMHDIELISYKLLTLQRNLTVNNTFNTSATSYTINYTDSNTGQSCSKATIAANSCTSGTCKHEFAVNSSSCPNKANFTIEVFGSNVFGDGNYSQPIDRGKVLLLIILHLHVDDETLD